ncbi:aminodeoxychorismate synthase component I [Filomicrobium sp.]|uniref:aminodeoxychorismate synthase component I n=1 Tax=Filomicrobium sp. TaxID=2024831 RepID=UPI00258DB6CE|nr:aminodeoxychorismate synthase component I [Filomicrobium sp.]MCV0369174.1 aminodeoxychorismate synthase component I [Filomicrobium sp.]
MTTQNRQLPRPPASSDAVTLSEAFVLLDNSSGSAEPSLLFTDPIEIVSAETPEEVAAALARIEAGIAQGYHAAGFFSYELGYVMEPKLAHLMPKERNVPLLWFGLYHPPRRMSGAEVGAWLDTTTRSESHEFSSVTLAWSREEYEARFAKVQAMIRAGDIYQLNLTFKSRFQLNGSPLTFYRDLRAKQRVAFAGIVDTGKVTVLSASPELFIAQHDRVIETRPMKGTAARAGTIEGDAYKRKELATDSKQRAENLMIVDLMRNDIGRISEIGSVEVTDLFTVETFKTLHQMTSGIRAQLKEGVGLEQLLRAIYPPGSITGAPKIRAMELIAELETEARGVYCGALGYLAPGGVTQLNVAIRTPIVMRDGRGEMGIGSGVVFDSQGGHEYDECLLKMKFLTDPPKTFELIETMLYEPGEGIVLEDRHFSRLAGSAAYFGFVYDAAAVRAAISNALSGRENERLRVRLTLSEDGIVKVTVSNQPVASPDYEMGYVISSTRLSSANAFLYHKTTRRELYDAEWADYNAACGADEVVYFNENGALCEGSRTNIFIERDGKLLTPPLSAGLLPGTFRAELLASGRAVEAPLALPDLENADTVYLGNSVRGLCRAKRLAG